MPINTTLLCNVLTVKNFQFPWFVIRSNSDGRRCGCKALGEFSYPCDCTKLSGGEVSHVRRTTCDVRSVVSRQPLRPRSSTLFSAVQLIKMTRVFIGRLSMSARESDVEKFLRGYGKVRDISLKRGYGFVVRYQCASISRNKLRLVYKLKCLV